MTQQKIKFDYVVNRLRELNDSLDKARSAIVRILQKEIDSRTKVELKEFMTLHSIELEVKTSSTAMLIVITDHANNMAFFPCKNPFLFQLITNKCPAVNIEQCLDNKRCKEHGNCLRND
jgi:hypothetical protein